MAAVINLSNSAPKLYAEDISIELPIEVRTVNIYFDV